jgi:hypothetical protein
LTDGDEVNIYGTDPLDHDSDDDGAMDGFEVNVLGTDPLTSTTFVNGDVDQDGDVDVSDLLRLEQILMEPVQ